MHPLPEAPRAAALLAALLAAAALAPAASAMPGHGLEAQSLEGAGRFQVGWRIVETVQTYEGRLAEGSERTLRIVVPQNVTDVTVSLRWSETDDPTGLSQPDAFDLAVEWPDGTASPGSPARSRAGVIRLPSGLVNDVPAPREVEAASVADVHRQLAREAGTAGTGPWKVTLRLVDAGNPGGAQVDTGNAYVLGVTVRHYEPVLTRIVSLEPPPTLTISEAARATPPVWVWSALLLAAAATVLGGLLARDASRRRRRASRPARR